MKNEITVTTKDFGIKAIEKSFDILAREINSGISVKEGISNVKDFIVKDEFLIETHNKNYNIDIVDTHLLPKAELTYNTPTVANRLFDFMSFVQNISLYTQDYFLEDYAEPTYNSILRETILC